MVVEILSVASLNLDPLRHLAGLQCALLLILLALMVHSSQLVSGAENGAHEDPSKLEFYLITVDVGNNVWDNFGHSALRVVDGLAGTDTIYNWGVLKFAMVQSPLPMTSLLMS